MFGRHRKARAGVRRILFSIAGGLSLLIVTRAAMAQEGGGRPPPARPAADAGDDDDAAEFVPLTAISKDAPASAKPPSSAPSTILEGMAKQVEAESSMAWAIPPVPWRASLLLNGGRSFPADGPGTTTMQQQLTGLASSYVWHPWFLKLDGGMNLGQSQGTSADARDESRTAGASLNGQLLPGTRQPLGFSVAMANSSAESRPKTRPGAVISDNSSLTLGLNQRYAPVDGSFAAIMSYNHLRADSSSSVTDGDTQRLHTTSHNAGGQLAIPIRSENPQSLNFNGSWSSTNNDQAGSHTRLYNLYGAHSIYLEDYVMTINSDVTLNQNSQISRTSDVQASTVQLGSSMDWIPSDDYPLSIGASVRHFNAATQSGGGDTRIAITTLTGDAKYPLNRNWNFSSQINGALVKTGFAGAGAGDATRQSFNAIANANWSGDGLSFKRGEWAHSIGYGAGSSLFTSASRGDGAAESDAGAGLGANASQVFTRTYDRAEQTPYLVSLNQSYSANATTSGTAMTHNLTHGANLSWGDKPRPDLQTRYSFAASDGRSFGGTTAAYQQVNGTASADMVTGAYSSLGGSGNMAFTRQFSGSGDGRWNGAAGAGGRYSHGRFAGVAGLNYQATYNLVVREVLSSDAGGSLVGGRFELQHSVNQIWSWRLGLLGWRIEHSAVKFGSGGIGQTVYLSVVRDFSGVL